MKNCVYHGSSGCVSLRVSLCVRVWAMADKGSFAMSKQRPNLD